MKCYEYGEAVYFTHECCLLIGFGGLDSGRRRARSISPRYQQSPQQSRISSNQDGEHFSTVACVWHPLLHLLSRVQSLMMFLLVHGFQIQELLPTCQVIKLNFPLLPLITIHRSLYLMDHLQQLNGKDLYTSVILLTCIMFFVCYSSQFLS